MHPDLSLLSTSEHQRALHEEARRARLVALVRCCRPSALRAALARTRAALLPAPACC